MIDNIMKFFGYVPFKVADRRICQLFNQNIELAERLEVYGVKVKVMNDCRDYSPEKVRYYSGVLDNFETEVKALKKENKQLKIKLGATNS